MNIRLLEENIFWINTFYKKKPYAVDLFKKNYLSSQSIQVKH